MRRFIGAAAFAVALAAGAAFGDDAVTIKIKKPGPGDVVKETETKSVTNKVSINVMGMTQDKDEEGLETFAFTDEVIERAKDAPKPTKLKRTYEKAEVTKDGTKDELGLEGKTVLIEKKGDKYSFTIDGKDVTGKGAEVLGKEFNAKKTVTEQDFLPTKPVKPGDTWDIDAAKLAADLAEDGLIADEKASKASGKLVKVYDKNGHKYGVLEITMTLAVTKLKNAGQEIPLKEGGKLEATITMDGCIDGTEAAVDGKMTMKGTLEGELMGVGLKISLDAKSNGKTAEVKK